MAPTGHIVCWTRVKKNMNKSISVWVGTIYDPVVPDQMFYEIQHYLEI